jgi:hypothetical protein
MTEPYRTADVANASSPIEIRPFIVSCAICSVFGFAVLAALAHSLLSFWGPLG